MSEIHQKIIKKITENFEEPFTSTRGVNMGKTIHKHKVVFTDGYQGIVFQTSEKLVFNGKQVLEGDTIRIKTTPGPTPKSEDRIEITDEPTTSGAIDGQGQKVQKPNKVVSGHARTFATGYAKDIVLHKNPAGTPIEMTADQIVEEIIRLSIVIEKHLLESL